jgi:hypothetical protein
MQSQLKILDRDFDTLASRQMFSGADAHGNEINTYEWYHNGALNVPRPTYTVCGREDSANLSIAFNRQHVP